VTRRSGTSLLIGRVALGVRVGIDEQDVAVLLGVGLEEGDANALLRAAALLVPADEQGLTAAPQLVLLRVGDRGHALGDPLDLVIAADGAPVLGVEAMALGRRRHARERGRRAGGREGRVPIGLGQQLLYPALAQLRVEGVHARLQAQGRAREVEVVEARRRGRRRGGADRQTHRRGEGNEHAERARVRHVLDRLSHGTAGPKVLAADANKARAAIAGRRDPAGIAEPYASAP
jgi:hypothetical protein